MNNSVLPQNSVIRGALGRNVTKKNISRWTPQQNAKKNEPSFYNKYLKNTFSSLIGSNTKEEVSYNNASTVVSEPEATSVANSSSNNNSAQGGEYERLIRRFKGESPNSSFGSFATRSLKRGGRRKSRKTKRSARRTHRKSRRSNRK